MRLFGIGQSGIIRSISKGEASRLEQLSIKHKHKSPEKIEKLVNKTIRELGAELKDPHKQALLVSFVADLTQSEKSPLLKKVIDEKLVGQKSLESAFETALIAGKGKRALEILYAKPSLLFHRVKGDDFAFDYFNEEALSLIVKSGIINEELLIEQLEKNG